VKGESSGNFLNLVSVKNDCDNDSLLIQVDPYGPTCHTGSNTCWGNEEEDVIDYLERTISDRVDKPSDKSYVSNLMKNGINKVAQKVGEEAVEVVIEAKDDNLTLFLEECADLLFHYLILLKAKNVSLSDVKKILKSRR
jgi:phosphoribosyl-ATP pyrophosphohydrolase/phosphoribosyl-AMP cyclohydrolase